jgi:hypothetical protein
LGIFQKANLDNLFPSLDNLFPSFGIIFSSLGNSKTSECFRKAQEYVILLQEILLKE